MAQTYRRLVLAERPAGMPDDKTFRIEEVPLPAPKDGEMLVKSIFLSVDPYMRGRLRDVASYAPPVQIGDVMVGGVAGQVVDSKHPKFPNGTFVNGMFGWQEYALSDGKGIRALDPKVAPISTSVGILGMPGATAYFGLLDVGQPKEGETVVVSGAAGAVGGLVGQIAKIQGCRAVGIAGGPAKCDYAVKELGFDACIDYKAEKDMRAAIEKACPKGVDVYFDNVGGPITDAVLLNLNTFGRVSICGQISQYNNEKPELGPRMMWVLLTKRAKMQGFIVSDFGARWGEALGKMAEWLQAGKLKYKEDVVRGLENAPAALQGVLTGKNFGKQLVQLADLPA